MKKTLEAICEEEEEVTIKSRRQDESHPLDLSNILSNAMFSWLTTLIIQTYKIQPNLQDLWSLSRRDKSLPNFERLKEIWHDEIEKSGLRHTSLCRVVMRFIRGRLLKALAALTLFCFALFLSNSIIVQSILKYVKYDGYPSTVWYAVFLIIILLISEMTRVFAFGLLCYYGFRNAVRCRGALAVLLFKKVVLLRPMAVNVAELINLISNDGDRIFDANSVGLMTFAGPVLFLCGTIYLVVIVGPLGLIGSAVQVLLIIVQVRLAKVVSKLRAKYLQITELRVRHIHEIIYSIKLIKMYSWESPFMATVEDLRMRELKIVKLAGFITSVTISIAFLAPVLASVVLFSVIFYFDMMLEPHQAYTCIAVLNTVSYAMRFLPIGMRAIVESHVALDRYKKVMSLENASPLLPSACQLKSNAIEVKDGKFNWQQTDQVTLDDDGNTATEITAVTSTLLGEEGEDADNSRSFSLSIMDFNVKKGSLVGIYGSVASGKSSFVCALMGFMNKKAGAVHVDGSVAYCSQQAVLFNITIRENILFGCEYDDDKYRNVILVCGLQSDLDSFPGKDFTEVGEQGVNMSGGQKQRISLARALYSDRDIYLLDDPLSAVDAHVGKHIFMEAIVGFLKKQQKTVLFITHQLHYLSYCDGSYVLVDGTIQQCSDNKHNSGTVQSDATTIDNNNTSVPSSNHDEIVKSPDDDDDDDDLIQDGKLMSTEMKGKAIPMSTYIAYMKAGGGCVVYALLIIFFSVNVMSQQFSIYWLTHIFNNFYTDESNLTLNDNDTSRHFNDTYVTNSNLSSNGTSSVMFDRNNSIFIYQMSALAMFIISIVRGAAYIQFTNTCSVNLHSRLLKSILNSSMRFFDTTPCGRIINRFQKDIDEMDNAVVQLSEICLFNSLMLVFSLGFVIYVFPLYTIVAVVLIPVYLAAYTLFKPAAREMKRLDTMSRSPWFAHISSTLCGIDTIRVYNQSYKAVNDFVKFLDENSCPFMLYSMVNRWFSARLDLLAIVSSLVTATFIVFLKDDLTPASAGLAFTSSLLISGLLQFATRLLTEVNARFVAVDRILDYIVNTPKETPASADDIEDGWLTNGKIEFCHVTLSYRPHLPPVLKDIFFTIHAGEKIGVVGRTGAGKSSLITALFRLVELPPDMIYIDNVDITRISTSNLRSSLSIIPQDPTLFSGTIRYNLDPFKQHSDEQLWDVLECTHLKVSIKELPEQLNTEIEAHKSRFSVGEKQLICLARVLLRRSKILILDEATAAVDPDTERIVHQAINQWFATSTVITIAHRLSTVLDCDRILALEKGQILEFDSPDTLLANKHSHFSRMMAVQ